MRKLMNKKGFSLVELMIVVVIMGILIAVAIPLYGAIQDNAKNKTCKNNMTTIRSNAANYYAQWGATPTDAQLKSTFDDGDLPHCPWTDKPYTYELSTDGAATVHCPSGSQCKSNAAPAAPAAPAA